MFKHSKILSLSSRDADVFNGNFKSDVKFNTRAVLIQEDNTYYNTVAVLSAEFPHSFYNVPETENTLAFSNGGTSYSFTIPEGSYNASNFITTFNSLFQSTTGQSATLSISRITGRFSLLGTSDIVIFDNGSTCFRILGLTEGVDHSFLVQDGATQFNTPANFLGTTKLKIFSNMLSSDNIDSNGLGANTLVDTIGVSSQSFGLINFTASQMSEFVLKHHTIDEIDLQIKNSQNNLVDFNGADWSITFVIHTYRKLGELKNYREFGKIQQKFMRSQVLREIKNIPKTKKLVEKINEEDPELELLLSGAK